jgi:hypothetical protein
MLVLALEGTTAVRVPMAIMAVRVPVAIMAVHVLAGIPVEHGLPVAHDLQEVGGGPSAGRGLRVAAGRGLPVAADLMVVVDTTKALRLNTCS